MFKSKVISAIIPAKDEAPSIGLVVDGLLSLEVEGQKLFDHIIVCDNGSVDETATIARLSGASVVYEAQAGYGQACLTGINALPKSDVVVFVDGDHSVYPEQSIKLIEKIIDGADLVIGSRVLGNTERYALTAPQIFGNWLASQLIRVLWKHSVTDLGPFRAISYDALMQLNMKDTRFGWTVEMQIKAIQNKMKMIELPVDTRVRLGVSKISGTVKGVIGAAVGIFGKIFSLWFGDYIERRSRCGKNRSIHNQMVDS